VSERDDPNASVGFEELGRRWGRGDFGVEDAVELQARLARRSGGSAAATLMLLTERGDQPTITAAHSAMEATRSLPQRARARMLTHPGCAHELSRLVQAIGEAEARGGSVAAAELLQSGYMRVVRGASVAAGLDIAWRSAGKEVLPIVGIVLEREHAAECRITAREGGIIVDVDGSVARLDSQKIADGIGIATGESTLVSTLPAFSIGGHRVHVDVMDPAFREGWIPRSSFGEIRVAAAKREDLPGWIDSLAAASRVVERVLPSTASMVGLSVRSFVPVVSSDPATACSESDASLPGAIMSTIDGPPVLAESIVHEFRHNLLHQLELSFPLYTHDSPTAARFYSPWRPDPRPLHGILHALFVFLDVCAIHAGVLELRLGDESDLHDSAVRIAGNARRIRIAIEEFRANARLTPFGRGFCAGIEEACGRFDPLVDSLPTAAVAEAEAEIDRHRRTWRRA
jgi:HEXXH motif-containing protein